METYLRRLYLQRKEEEESRSYPVWDYRSRRSSLSTTLSSGDGSSLSCASSSRSEVEMSESGSSVSSGSGCSDTDGMALRDPARLTFELLVDPHEVYPLLDLYDPLIGWIDPDLRLFHAGSRAGESSASCVNANVNRSRALTNSKPKGILVNKNHNHHHHHHHHRTTDNEISTSFRSRTKPHSRQDDVSGSGSTGRTADDLEPRSPPFSVILFLYEEEVCAGGRVDSARSCLESAPWRLHHCEKAPRKNLNLNPKSLDYFYISEDLPLWSVRQVHYGKEHIRLVVQTQWDTWEDMVDFYRLILGFEPDFLREDFCLFTVHSQINFDIQFALKRGDPSSAPSPAHSTRLRFKVADLGRLVPLFPNVCQPVSESCWLTTDHDGNEVILDVTSYGVSGGMTSSGSDRGSSDSCASASSSDVSFDSHDSGHCHGSYSGDSGGQVHPRSTLDTFRLRKSVSGIISSGLMNESKRKSQRRVTFCLEDVPPMSSSDVVTSAPPRVKPVSSGRVPSPCSSSAVAPESMFNLRFDTCPTAPLSRNNTREEQIGFYV